MFKRKHYIAFGAVTLATLLMLSLPSRTTTRLKLAIGSLFLPLFGLAGTAQRLPATALDAVLPRRELLHEIQTLRRQNQRLRVQALHDAGLVRENDQLRALVGWQRRAPWKLKLARVVLRDPANWWRTVEIDLGSRDGLTNNLPVLTPGGLVGRVAAVGYARSQVLLVGDPDCKVAVLVDNAAHDMGIIGPGGPLDNSLVRLSYLSGNAQLKPGELVVTSGLGGIFPKGIPVGRIVDSRQVEFGLYTEAQVKLSAHLGALEQVWVLLQ